MRSMLTTYHDACSGLIGEHFEHVDVVDLEFDVAVRAPSTSPQRIEQLEYSVGSQED